MFENEYGEKVSRKGPPQKSYKKEKKDIDGFNRRKKLEPCKRIKPKDLTKHYLNGDDDEC